jgi:hypothetical protein
MGRTIDQIRASKLPSNMMQFAARGALQVPPAENIEILVYLAKYNKVFGELARMTLAGWDEKASLAVAADPKTPQEVLNYFISPDNLRPKLLPSLLENPSIREEQIVRVATSAVRETIDILLNSPRVRSSKGVLETLKINPYLKQQEVAELNNLIAGVAQPRGNEPSSHDSSPAAVSEATRSEVAHYSQEPSNGNSPDATFGPEDETVFAYFKEHADDISAEGEKPFQAIGGTLDMFLSESSEADAEEVHAAESPVQQASAPEMAVATPGATPARTAATPANPGAPPKRQNTMQKINSLDVKGRIQLALKGNKEERSILIRDGTKVVSLAVLEAPKLSDGEVERFASQKNVLEAVLRQIPLKRRFMKNYKIVRNLVANPRTPLDLGLSLMKNLLMADLKNLSANKEVSETIRNLAGKMYKQKLDAANKK